MADYTQSSLLLILFSISVFFIHGTDGSCSLLREFVVPDGLYYSWERGLNTHTTYFVDGRIEKRFRPEQALDNIQDHSTLTETVETGECVDMLYDTPYGAHKSLWHYKMLYRTGDCYQCVEVYNRTRNVLQYRATTCSTKVEFSTAVKQLCPQILPSHEFLTQFAKNHEPEECLSTLFGTYHFTYERDVGGGGICNNPFSNITACPDPGTPFNRINQRFFFHYRRCESVMGSFDRDEMFSCMGSWLNERGDRFSAISNDRVASDRYYDKYRCMLTRDDQPAWFTKSDYPECKQLRTPYEGPERIVMSPIVPEEAKSQCYFPANFTGEWVNTANRNARVIINSTHIHEIIKVENRGPVREVYYACEQISRTQYLVKSVEIGDCYAFYLCFDILPRHHNILRFRKGKPFRVTRYNQQGGLNPFRDSCDWTSFGHQREWKYSTFVLYPPAASECPFTGVYTFSQKGKDLVKNRIRGGATPRPRDGGWYIECDQQYFETQLAVCGGNTREIAVDAERCSELNEYGTPIGIYDMPDFVFTCVGHWREDSRSYLVTYDREEPFNKFRCWVYERIDMYTIYMSRSLGSACSVRQRSDSWSDVDGVGLFMELRENERIHDDCPMRYDDGRNPYMRLVDDFLPAAAATTQPAVIISLLCLFIRLFL